MGDSAEPPVTAHSGSTAPFVHLHVHTQYSLLESAVKISELMTRARALQMPAVAITDHGNMFGAVDFYLAAKSAEIKPIIGCEIYYTTGSRFQKSLGGTGKSKRLTFTAAEEEQMRNYRLVLLCKDAIGYRNLCEIVTRGFTEGFHGKPRADRELISQYHEGLVALSAGLKGEVAYHCASGRPEQGEAAALWFREVFKDDYYLELQENGLPAQSQANVLITEFAERQNIPTVAAADVHYLDAKAGGAHEVLMCIAAGRTLDDTKAVRLSPDEFWLKDAETMRRQFAWNPEAVARSLEVAAKCNFSFKMKDEKGRAIYYLPDFRPKKEDEEKTGSSLSSGIERHAEVFSAEEYLRSSARAGLKERLQTKSVDGSSSGFEPAAYESRLESELDMIVRTGFSGYFLVVADFIQYAKRQQIPVGPGRGSGAGSLVAWALQITDIDPIQFNLLFERFINPERISLPDFDVDFCQDRRAEVIQYVIDKYGKDNVSQIITFGKLLARGVIRDVGRVLHLTYAEVDALAKLIPEELGITLDQAFEKEPRLREWTEKDPRVAQLFETARALEGLSRHASVHAAGVVITNRPLVEYCPLYVGKEGESVVQFDKDFAEKVGLVKFDFLGLKTLTVIDNAVKFIRESQEGVPGQSQGTQSGTEFELRSINYNDPVVYRLISSGDTDGVFQLESSGMKDLCVRVQPSNLEDITAINALYRPGPLNSGMVDDYINRKHGRTAVEYEVPQLADILQETYGVIVYQEQVMRVARVLADYSLGEADILRRAMGKKKPEEMAKQRDKFLAGCAKNNLPPQKAEHIFDLLAKFAEYGFNKSHSAAYGVLSYQTAYLKAYYPAQFMAALMATEINDTEKMAHYISDAKKHGILILPPDVNHSRKSFSVIEVEGKTAIRFGLEAIKGVGGVAVDSILAERQERGEFKSFYEFCTRVTQRKVNKKVLESLISVGAFDRIAEQNRATLFESVTAVMDHAADVQEERDLGQVSMFDQYEGMGFKLEVRTDHLFKRTDDWTDSKKLQLEKQLVGFYVSGHPLERVWPLVQPFVQGDLNWVRTEFERRKALPASERGAGSVASASAKTGGGGGGGGGGPRGPYGRQEAPRWEIVTAGLISSMREIVTKKGSKMAFAEIEDLKGKMEMVCFPEAYEAHQESLRRSMAECLPLVISANISLDEEAPKLFLRSVDWVDAFQKKKIQSVLLRLAPTEVNPHLLAQLRAILVRHRGKCAAFLEYAGVLAETSFKSRHALPQELCVNPSAELTAEVNALFGRNVVLFG